jgi:hypothetical protein
MIDKITEILNHHLTAFGHNDQEEIMKDFTEESELLTVDSKFKGLEGIRQFFKELFIILPSGSTFEMFQRAESSNAALLVWSSESGMAKIPFGSDTFVFDKDKIRLHTVSKYIIRK